MLYKDSGVQHNSITQWQEDRGQYDTVIVSWSTAPGQINAAYFRDDSLVRFSLQSNCGEKLQDVIDVLGPPAGFEIVVDRGGIRLMLNYASRGALLWTDYAAGLGKLDELKQGTLRISPALCIDSIDLFEPMALADAWASAYFEPNPSVIAQHLRRQQTWQGFGPVRVENWE